MSYITILMFWLLNLSLLDFPKHGLHVAMLICLKSIIKIICFTVDKIQRVLVFPCIHSGLHYLLRIDFSPSMSNLQIVNVIQKI